MRQLRALVIALLGVLRLRRTAKEQQHSSKGDDERIVASAPPNRGSELVVVALLLAAAVCAVAFIVFYAIDDLPSHTQLLGLSFGLALAFAAAALIVTGHRLVVSEEIAEEYPEPEEPEEQEAVVEIVHESGDRLTRKRLLGAAAGAAGTAIGLAAITPAASLGPGIETKSLYDTPWRRGRRLVDDKGKAYAATEIEQGTFYTAFPENAKPDTIGAPVVVVRLDPAALQLPAGRSGWAPQGIMAFSKVCTHAGCAIALYRKPLFPPVQPRPALLCPCHYSTFDPAKGGEVIFGPAGRPLPQLPLTVDGRGELRAGGNFSGPVGPSWWGVREDQAS